MNNHMAYLKEGHQEPTEGIEIFKNNDVQIKEDMLWILCKKLKPQ
ncbi:hypothetical protein [Escherichia phage ST2]|jgi:hypothetical protein|nr:hypothetical protein [Escherichia phage ST2]